MEGTCPKSPILEDTEMGPNLSSSFLKDHIVYTTLWNAICQLGRPTSRL